MKVEKYVNKNRSNEKWYLYTLSCVLNRDTNRQTVKLKVDIFKKEYIFYHTRIVFGDNQAEIFLIDGYKPLLDALNSIDEIIRKDDTAKEAQFT